MSVEYLNPPFHPRMLQIGSPQSGSKKLVRGRLVTDPDSKKMNTTTGRRTGIRFMYNPVAITAAHYNNINTNNTGMAGSALSQAGVTGGNNMMLGDVSFSLLFDRTYDVYEGGRGQASTLGVYVDVLAFYQLLGITPQRSTTKTIGGFLNETTVWRNMYPQAGIDMNIHLDVFIGDKLKFFGYCDNCTITYTHWSRKMIPMRCEVDIDIQFIDNPSSKGAKITQKTTKKNKVGGGHPMTTIIPGSNVNP